METDPRKHRPAILAVAGLAAIVILFFAAIIYARHQDEAAAEQDARDSRRQDFALCVVQNENRQALNQQEKSIRIVAGSLFSILTTRIARDPPTEPGTLKQFIVQARILQRELKALKRGLPEIDCDTYVRPDLPPDTGA